MITDSTIWFGFALTTMMSMTKELANRKGLNQERFERTGIGFIIVVILRVNDIK
jgi:hypothetical protein